MATRLEDYISHGAISNTEPGKVSVTLWFIGAENPIVLELDGNAHRDIAGGSVTFKNPSPKLEPGDNAPDIPAYQEAIAGDITASRKVYFQEGVLERIESGGPTLVNSLCIEWYNTDGQRFVIDTSEFEIQAGESEWLLDSEAEKQQLTANTERFHAYIDAIAKPVTENDETTSDSDEDDDLPLNEFEWEERLKESDRITQAYMEALDKYQDLPNQEDMVAAAMGWDQPSKSEPQVDWFPSDDDENEFTDDYIPFEEAKEVDDELWIDSEDRDEESHPLYERAKEFSNRLHRDAQDLGLLESEEDERAEILRPEQILVFASMELSTKLAGALNGINGQSDPEPGLIVAWLKRGLPIVDRALGAIESSVTQATAPQDWIEKARIELFEIRASMLDLIQEFRKQLP